MIITRNKRSRLYRPRGRLAGYRCGARPGSEIEKIEKAEAIVLISRNWSTFHPESGRLLPPTRKQSHGGGFSVINVGSGVMEVFDQS